MRWFRAFWLWLSGLFRKRGLPRPVDDAPPGNYSVVDRYTDGTVALRFGPTPDARLAKRIFYKPVPLGAVREFRDGPDVRSVRHPE